MSNPRARQSKKTMTPQTSARDHPSPFPVIDNGNPNAELPQSSSDVQEHITKTADEKVSSGRRRRRGPSSDSDEDIAPKRSRKTPSRPTKQLESPPLTKKAAKGSQVAQAAVTEASPGARRSARTRKPNISYKGHVEPPCSEDEDDNLAIGDEADAESDVASDVESESEDDEEMGRDGLLDDVPEEELILASLRIDQLESLDRSKKVSPLVRRFDTHLSHIINKIFDKAASLDADTDFGDRPTAPMSRDAWRFLRVQGNREKLIDICLNSIRKEVKLCFGKESWSKEELLALPDDRTNEGGIYSIFVEGPKTLDGYVGQTCAQGCKSIHSDGTITRCGKKGFERRWFDHERAAEKGIAELQEIGQARALYHSACRKGHKMHFRALAKFPIPHDDREIRLLRGALNVMESALMIYLHTYQIDAYTRPSPAALNFAQDVRLSTTGTASWAEPLNRAFPLREGLLILHQPENPWTEREVEILTQVATVARDKRGDIVGDQRMPRGTWNEAVEALKAEGFKRTEKACSTQWRKTISVATSITWSVAEVEALTANSASVEAAVKAFKKLGSTRSRNAIIKLLQRLKERGTARVIRKWDTKEKEIIAANSTSQEATAKALLESGYDRPITAIVLMITALKGEGIVPKLQSKKWSAEEVRIVSDSPNPSVAVERLAEAGFERPAHYTKMKWAKHCENKDLLPRTVYTEEEVQILKSSETSKAAFTALHEAGFKHRSWDSVERKFGRMVKDGSIRKAKEPSLEL